VVSERLKIRGSLARKALNELHEKGLIRQVIKHHSQIIYTRTTKADDAAEEEAAEAVEEKGGKTGKKGKQQKAIS